MPQYAVRALAEEDAQRIRNHGWRENVGRGTGIWVRVARQRLLVVRGRRVLRSFRCSTAASGVGNVMGSGCTPTGWHEIGEKIGAGLPPRAILKGRQWTGEVWRRGQCGKEDLILSRILRLRGLDDGVNRGGRQDSWERFIYIHGTNAERDLGRPASKGCVRLANKDAIQLFEIVRVCHRVLITPE